MPLEIFEREREGVVVLDVRGRITAGADAAAVRNKLRALAAERRANVILNLRDVDFIDSTGLGALVVGHTVITNAGGRLALENLSGRNIELLVVTKLTTVFDIFDDEQQAVNSFFAGRQIRKFDILNFVREQSGE